MSGLPLIGQYILAFIFLISSLSKCLDIGDFRISIKQFGIVNSEKLINFSSILFIISELSISFLLIFYFHSVITFFLSVGMMLFFIAILIKATLEKKSIHCSCFGKSTRYTNKTWAITRNFFIITLIAFSSIYQEDTLLSWLDNIMVATVLVNVALLVIISKEKYRRKRYKACIHC